MANELGRLEDEILRARQAQEVIEHPLYQEAFNKLQAELMQEWQSSAARDTEGREKLWLMLKLLERTKGHLETLMQTGKLAAVQKQNLLQSLNLWSGKQSLY